MSPYPLTRQTADENFVWFESKGIENLSQLRKSFSSLQKMAAFAAESGIPEDYLVILKREMSSLEQKPVLIASFPDIDASLVKRLNEAGVKNSKDYWERNQPGMDELFSLCDLVRINGVGPVAAKAGFMLEKVTAVNAAIQKLSERIVWHYSLLKKMIFC